MYKIVRLTKEEKITKKALAVGDTEHEAWEKFNLAGGFMNYPDTTIFSCVNVNSHHTTSEEKSMSDQELISRYLESVEKQPQAQFATVEQLVVLQAVANKLGLYDAADWLARQLHVGR